MHIIDLTYAGLGIHEEQSVAEELGVSTVPDTADIYQTEPAEASAA